MIKDLGQVAAIYIGTTEPINYTLLWLDTNTNPGVYKAYDSNLKQWVPLATQSWVQNLIDNWIQNWPVADDIVEGDYILINKGGVNYKIEAQDVIQNLIGKPLNFQNIVSNGSQLPASASDLKNGDLYILNVPGDIDTQVVTQPTQQVFPNRSILFWDEGEWKSMGRVEWKCDLSMVQTSDTVIINSSLGTGITIPTATDSQAGVLSAILFTYLTKLSNGTVIPRTPNGSTQTPGHIHNYTDIEGRIIVIDTVGDINKDLDTSNPPSQRAVTEALYTKYDKTGGEISGIVRITDGTEATQLGEGALIVNGGLSIFKNVYFGENLDVVGATYLHSTLDVDGITHILNTTDSTANNNGALVVDGGVGVAKNVNIGGAVDIDGNSSLHGTLTVDGATTLNSTLHTVGAVTFDNTLDVAGVSNFNNTTESTAYTNGAVVVDGGVGIAKRLNVHGATDIDSTLNVDGATTLNNTLHGVGAVTFDNTLTVAGITHITNETNSSGPGMGALVVDGGVSVGGMINVSGDAFLRDDLTVTNDTYLRGNLVVSGATEVQDITIHGNVTQEGQSFITKAETVEIKDNILLINRGEVGAGVTAGLAGIEVDRGTSPNFQFVFDESDDYFKAGEIGDLQILLLRDADANLTNNKFFYWDNTNKIAKTREILIADISDLGATWDAQLKGAIYQKTLRVNNGNYPIYRPNNIDFPANLYAPTTLSTDSRQVIVGASSGSAPTWDFPTMLKTYDKGRISTLGLGRATTPSTMYTRFDIFSTNAASLPGTDSISGDRISDGVVQTYFWDNTTHAVQLALDIDGTGVAYRSYNPSDGTVRGGWKFLASTSWVNSHVNEELEAYLPLTGGTLTGALHITSGGLNVTSGRIRGVEARGMYINGKTLTNALLSASFAQVSNSYSPYFAAQMLNGDVVNIGGIGNKFGIYGYDAARTENGQDWLFEFNSDDGSLNNSICLGSESNTAYLGYRIRRSGVTTEFSNSGTHLNLSITNGSTFSSINMTPAGELTFNSNNIYHAGNLGTITFTGAVSATYNGQSNITVNIPQGGGGVADISISNGPAVSGQYVSGMSESSGVITLTRATLPTLSGGASATSGQYVSGVTVSGHTVTVTKANLPTVTLSSLGITATAAEINKLDGLTATTTELNYVDGVTSNIQTQLNNKAASTHTHTVAQINNLGTNWSARLTAAINVKSVNINGTATSYLNTTNATAVTIYAPTSAGTDGYLLVSNGSGAPSWASVSSVIGTGFVTIDTAQTITGAKTFTAYTIFSNGAGTATSSDKRLKENIKEITYNKGFDEISLYSYNFKGRKEEKIGLIAQEVQKVIPQAVIKDEEGYLAIDTYPIVATLVAANGERVKEVKDLKSEIDNLKQEIEMLKQEISILKRIVRL